MTELQELVSELETLTPEGEALVLRFCKLLQDPAFMARYERKKMAYGGVYPPDLLEAFMDRFEGGSACD